MERAIASVVLAATVALLAVALAPRESRRSPSRADRRDPLSSIVP